VPVANLIRLADDRESGDVVALMWDLCKLIWWVLVDLFRPRAKLEAEILVLRPRGSDRPWSRPRLDR